MENDQTALVNEAATLALNMAGEEPIPLLEFHGLEISVLQYDLNIQQPAEITARYRRFAPNSGLQNA